MTPTLITLTAIALLCALAFFLFPKFGAGLWTGIREFRKASDQIVRGLRGDEDDNDPHAA